MPETLEIKKLGPIGKLTIHPRPLTILIGEQASGKSLVAQVLYFFRGLYSHVGRLYTSPWLLERGWQDAILRRILDDLRGVPFAYFANGTATIRYSGPEGKENWMVTATQKNRACRASKTLASDIERWFKAWSEESRYLGAVRRISQVYITTERSVFTRLYATEPSVLYAEYQPEPLRRFASVLDRALRSYPPGTQDGKRNLPWTTTSEWPRSLEFIAACQRRAIRGEAYVPARGPKKWKWRVSRDNGAVVVPIEATASGQMEAWPFFAIASVFATGAPPEGVSPQLDIYFEEPETHLHPRAQWEVMKAVVYLVTKLGHSFVITTHSPFVAYAVNNMIQRHLSYKGQLPDDALGIDPNMVAAYRLKASPDREPEDIMDREYTNLIKLDELDSVADEMGEEFDRLLDMEG